MESLEQFIPRRRAEIADELSRLSDALRRLEEESTKLDVAAEAIGLVEEAPPADRAEEHRPAIRALLYARAKRRLSEATIKDLVVRILRDRPNGLPASEILAIINKQTGADYPRSSLSPQLSRLKADGLIALEGGVWSLAGFEEIDPAHSKSVQAGVQGPFSTAVKPVGEVVHDNTHLTL